jgi:hypothetical protein
MGRSFGSLLTRRAAKGAPLAFACFWLLFVFGPRRAGADEIAPALETLELRNKAQSESSADFGLTEMEAGGSSAFTSRSIVRPATRSRRFACVMTATTSSFSRRDLRLIANVARRPRSTKRIQAVTCRLRTLRSSPVRRSRQASPAAAAGFYDAATRKRWWTSAYTRRSPSRFARELAHLRGRISLPAPDRDEGTRRRRMDEHDARAPRPSRHGCTRCSSRS